MGIIVGQLDLYYFELNFLDVRLDFTTAMPLTAAVVFEEDSL